MNVENSKEQSRLGFISSAIVKWFKNVGVGVGKRLHNSVNYTSVVRDQPDTASYIR